MKQKVVVKRYSVALKQKIVREYEAGANMSELRRKYGIGGGATIRAWVEKYGREGLRHKLIVIQSPEEQSEVKGLRLRVKQLEKLVAQLSLDKLMLEASLSEAEELLGGEVKKKRRSQIIERVKRTAGEQVKLARICGWFGISRQAHYQMLHRQQERQQQNEYILSRVREFRQRHPWMGARKILHELRPELQQKGFLVGRDRFFELLAHYDLLLPRHYQKRRTTWSGLWHAPNLIKTLKLVRVQQVWVCDITYLETEEGFCYLALVTDAFSRFIVGFDVSTSLAVEGALRALKQGIAQAHRPLNGLVHHSDHGVQYTCSAYRDELAEHKILSSMGEVGNCYDNALAERVNGILKLEYALNSRFVDVAQAVTAVKQAVWLYNNERPHLSLNYAKPVEIHFRPFT